MVRRSAGSSRGRERTAGFNQYPIVGNHNKWVPIYSVLGHNRGQAHGQTDGRVGGWMDEGGGWKSGWLDEYQILCYKLCGGVRF